MDDRQLWNIGSVRLNDMLVELPAEAGLTLTKLLNRYQETKEALAAAVAEVDTASICHECGGQCCRNGKYRINVFDTLARIAAEIPTPADFTQKPLCPYGTDAGCTMEPGLRPADCVLFICDAIDRKLSPEVRSILAAQEQVLRECISGTSTLTGEPMGTPLLLWAAKNDDKSSTKV